MTLPTSWRRRRTSPPPVPRRFVVVSDGSELARRTEAAADEFERARVDISGPTATIVFEPPHDLDGSVVTDLTVAVVASGDGVEEAWSRSGALDVVDRILVHDDLAAKRIAVAWGSGIAEVLPTGEGAEFVLEQALGSDRTARIGVSTAARSHAQASEWGDTHFARGLMRAFRRRGLLATEIIKPDWGGPAAAGCDVIVHLRGLARRHVDRDQTNVLWIISHPERVTVEECDDYDIVCSASATHASELSARIGRDVVFLPQATDADTFTTGRPNPQFEVPVLYIGNSRWPPRRGPQWLVREGVAFDLYGRGWEDRPESTAVRAEGVPNRELASAYRSAGVVVADHHGTMRRHGFVSNRLFDVLASGGVVLSDDVTGLADLLGDLVPTYSTPAELATEVRRLTGDAGRRREIATAGPASISSAHTLDHRAAVLSDLVDLRPR